MELTGTPRGIIVVPEPATLMKILQCPGSFFSPRGTRTGFAYAECAYSTAEQIPREKGRVRRTNRRRMHTYAFVRTCTHVDVNLLCGDTRAPTSVLAHELHTLNPGSLLRRLSTDPCHITQELMNKESVSLFMYDPCVLLITMPRAKSVWTTPDNMFRPEAPTLWYIGAEIVRP